MTLNNCLVGTEEFVGSSLLNFRGREWLNSWCIRAGLLFLVGKYASKNVGFVGPDWFPFKETATRVKCAASNGAFKPGIIRIIGIANRGRVSLGLFFY